MAKISIDLKEGKLAEQKTETEFIVGIDLGTTNSLVAYVRDGDAVIIKDAQKSKKSLLPSIIHFEKDGSVLVGDEARSKLTKSPERTIFSVKRLLGKSYNDLKEYKSGLSYQIIDEDEETLVKVRIDDRFYTPVELSAIILRSLNERVKAQVGRSAARAVITVPAYFNDSQRQATRDAGKLAGLDVLRIINEPTAASLAYGIGLDRDQSQTIAVYDLGGGTFDLSILHLEHGIFEVLATNGNTFLGGDDIDNQILNHWKIDADKTDAANYQSFRLAAEEAKKHLSFHESFTTDINGETYSLNRNDFNQLITPLVKQTLDHCSAALKDAKLKINDIDQIIMVGGSTRIPFIKESVSAFFGKQVNDDLNPDEVVALGAAIQADILAGNRKDLLLLDVTPLSLGIETMGGLMDTIIARNSKIPTKVARQYTTSIDGQVNLKIAVYQGERDLVADNRKLGEFVLSGIPPMPAGLPKIEVSFTIDADGLLRVSAKELRSDVEQQIVIKSQYGISEEQMSLMLIDSLKNAEQDLATRSLLEAVNEANNVLLSTGKFIEQHSSLFDESQIKKLKSLSVKLKNEIQQKDKDQIQAAMQELNDFAAPMAHQAMDETISSAMKGKKI